MKIRWSVLGSCGIAKRRTIPEGILAADNAELVSIYDVNTQANNAFAKELGISAAASEQQLISDDIDAVYIATPANLHYQQVLDCAKAGKHILCEKPLGMTNKEAKQMVAACKEGGVKLGTAFMMRFHSQHQAALKMIQQGKLGKLTYGRTQLSCWYPPIEGAWRQDPKLGGGGSLMDLGGHCIDLLEMFFGKVKKVSCFINNTVHDYKTEDSAVAMLFFENGAIATVDTFFCIPDNSSKNVLELYGSKGSILAKGTIGQSQAAKMTAILVEDEKGYDAQQARSENREIVISPEPVNMYRAEIQEFSQAIIDDKETCLNGEIALRSQEILAACYESASSGKIIEL